MLLFVVAFDVAVCCCSLMCSFVGCSMCLLFDVVIPCLFGVDAVVDVGAV